MQVCHSTIIRFSQRNARRTQQAASPTPTCHVCAPSPRPSCKQPTQNHGRATTLDTERHMIQAARAPNSIQQAPREKQQRTNCTEDTQKRSSHLQTAKERALSHTSRFPAHTYMHKTSCRFATQPLASSQCTTHSAAHMLFCGWS